MPRERALHLALGAAILLVLVALVRTGLPEARPADREPPPVEEESTDSRSAYGPATGVVQGSFRT